MDSEKMLQDVIELGFRDLACLKPGTEEYRYATDALTKMVDRQIDIDKLYIDNENKLKEIEIREKQMEQEKRSKFVQNAITVGMFVVTSALTIWGTKAAFRFDETGTITSTLGRGYLNRFLPKK